MVRYECMQHTTATLLDTETLTRELDELDRVLHRVRTQLNVLPKKKSQLEHWREMRGILIPHLTIAELSDALRNLGNSPVMRSKLPEDPVVWQRKIRNESDRHRNKLLEPYLKTMRSRHP